MKLTPVELPIRGEGVSLRLRPVGPEDQETLRRWRNRHRDRFFQSAPLSRQDQNRWFAEYQTRSDDFLFLLLVNGRPTGCIGIRRCGKEWDVYNVLRGRSGKASAGAMSKALRAVLEFADQHKSAPVTLTVLTDNPAFHWYARQGFRVVEDRENHLKMRLEASEQNRDQP